MAAVLLATGPLSATKPGDIDRSFDPGSATRSAVRAVAVDDQGRLLVAGGFTTFNGTPAPRLVRLLENGRIDPGFQIGKGADGEIKAVEVLADQRILVGGQFKNFAGKRSIGLALLQRDGSVDPTFVSRFTADGFSVGVTSLAALQDGRFVVGGYFTKYAGQSVGRYVFLQPDGKPDPTVSRKNGADSHVLDIDPGPDESILLGGFFRKLGDHATASVARLHPDGTVDTEFSVTTGPGSVAYTVAAECGGTTIAGGVFKEADHPARKFLMRIGKDGAPDAEFAAADGFDLNVYSLTVDPSDRILVAGQFKKFRDKTAPGICRLLPDGKFDSDFSFTGAVSASFIQEFPIDAKGRILAYGWMPFPGRARPPALCRLIGDTPSRED